MCTEGVEGEKPAPPVDLQAVVNDLGGVDLSWVDQADNEIDYLVYRRYNDDDDINADGDFVVIAELPANSTSYTDSDVDASMFAICYLVKARNEFGKSRGEDVCTEGVEGEKPARPVDLQAVVNDLGGVDLSWVDQADNETDYLVYRRFNEDDDINADGDFVVIAELPANSTSYTDSDVDASVFAICYLVKARNEFGKSRGEDVCTEGVEGEKPVRPVDLQAVVNDLGGVDLSWVDQADNETDYLVYRRFNEDDDINADGDFVVIAELPANSTSYTDSDVDASVFVICYLVKARNEFGKSRGEDVCTGGGEGEKPAPPVELEALVNDLGGVDLGWVDQADNETGYLVYRSHDDDGDSFTDDDFGLIAELPANSTGYTDLAVNATEAVYCYLVKAVNEFGKSRAEDVCTEGEKPEAPDDLEVGVGDLGDVELSWIDRADDEFAYLVYRGADHVDARATDDDFDLIATLDANATSYHDSKVNALETVFCYRVTAMSSFGESHGEKACTGVFDVPDPPKAVKAKPAEDAIDLRWKDRSANEDGFVVTMKKKRLWPEIAEVDASKTTLTVGGLKAGRRYCFRVAAFNSAGESKARKRCARAGS